MSNELIDKLELQSSLLDEMFGLQNNSEEVDITDEELREIEKWYKERFDNNDEQEKSGGFGRSPTKKITGVIFFSTMLYKEKYWNYVRFYLFLVTFLY